MLARSRKLKLRNLALWEDKSKKCLQQFRCRGDHALIRNSDNLRVKKNEEIINNRQIAPNLKLNDM
jgi:hypothetical protein